MCGILTVIGDKPVNELALETFENQEHRGTSGFGIIKIKENLCYKVERSTEGYKFMWDIHQGKNKMIIIHHRIPTSSPNLISQTHPIEVDNGSLKFKYLVIHNGIITNATELKKEHEKLGFIYTTELKEKFNDSESLAIELGRFIEDQTKEVGTQGSAAFIALQINKETNKITTLYWGRHDNPLGITVKDKTIILASEHQEKEIEENKLYSLEIKPSLVPGEIKENPIKFKPEPIRNFTYSSDNSYGRGWDDFSENYKKVTGFSSTPLARSITEEDEYKTITINDTVEDLIDAEREDLASDIEDDLTRLLDSRNPYARDPSRKYDPQIFDKDVEIFVEKIYETKKRLIELDEIEKATWDIEDPIKAKEIYENFQKETDSSADLLQPEGQNTLLKS